MTPKQVLQYFGTQATASKALGIKQPSVHQWIKQGWIPAVRQYQIQVITDGLLVADTPTVAHPYRNSSAVNHIQQ